MRNLVVCCVLGLMAGGCATFAGDWLEDGVMKDGKVVSAEKGQTRLALNFDPISTVRTGNYAEEAGVVDSQSVQSDRYFVFDGGHTAQFGATIANLQGDRITATAAGVQRQFSRVHGRSIFPPLVKLPPFTRLNQAMPERYAAAAP